MKLTRTQYELLRAVEAGHVADRKHARLGLDVSAAAQRLRVLGVAEPAEVDPQCPWRDRPWRLTVTGRLELAAQAAKRRDDR